MEVLNLPYSQKNIPIPSKFAYQKQLVAKTEHFTRRLRWKMFFLLNPRENTNRKETFGFRGTNNPPQVKELKAFEDDLFNLIHNIRYKPTHNLFQEQLKKDKQQIINNPKMIVGADKTSNLYMMGVDEYNKRAMENITKEYKKCSGATVSEVVKQAATIARLHHLEDRIDAPTQSEAFITIKDHKEGFPGRVDCRLINPAKNHIGSISKHFLDRINNCLRSATSSNQWQNTGSVLNWFSNIPNKANLTFFKFDIVSFYPSITEKLLLMALNWARTLTAVSSEEENTILHCRRSFLFYNKEAWVKKENSNFDVGMGSLDSAEVCELVGLFILHKLEKLFSREMVGLYRDDGLAVTSLPGPGLGKLRKEVIKVFSSFNLKITIEAGMKVTDFLDVTLNLQNNIYRPYRKDKNPPIYIQRASNHPPHIIKQLPRMIGKRISAISSNKEVFDAEAPVYNLALRNSGYTEEVQYTEEPTNQAKRPWQRKREWLWYNPPWNAAVSTNTAAKFLRLIDKHFNKLSPFHKYFNRQTVKVSYSCTPNMASIISSHNRRVTGVVEEQVERGCNCRSGPANCVLQGRCLTPNVVYKCAVSTQQECKEYIGLTANTFKQRYYAHNNSFNKEAHAHSTALSTHIWELKKNNIPFTTNWSIQRLAAPYNKETQRCQLCLTEKALISLANNSTSLNKRNEIVSKCRHRDKYLLKHW